LDGERTGEVAGLERLPVGGDDADPEQFRVGVAEFRNVGRDVAAGQRPVASVQILDGALKFVFHEWGAADSAIAVPAPSSRRVVVIA